MGRLIYSLVYTNDRQQQLNDQLAFMNGFSEERLFTVCFEEITAVVSEIEKTGLIANQANAILFADIIDQLHQHFTLLPMCFGSIMNTDDSVYQWLKMNYHELFKNMTKVENKLEFGLKIYCNPENLKKELRLERETETEKFSESLPGQSISVYRDYVNKKLKAHRLEQKFLSYIEVVTSEISEMLNRWNAEKKMRKMAASTNVVDAVFLLDQDRKAELISSVESLQAKYPRLSFVLTGPWPPYNFVDVTLK
ncbi:MAG: GvpL/GvpF family gas vesicle protein [Bacteroidales bacterium]|nr:GvpL/GvpF family gas vesicle protein [Bacteroidales bacterium]